ncbi:uncharacterized protein LOC116265811 [Nymphaea colorata]|uniref:uncharacterized protein LOC116265811 n=1 Tax=Nymphaea colorata TaxID=210225 RepID=UPI00129D80CB|nr:uncharacterized protein LOC116265811 [Nymphaea colorata]
MEDNGPSRENQTWTEAQMDYLVQLLVEQSRILGMKSGGGLKSKAYTTIEKSMMERFGLDFSKDKIKNKLKYSKPNLTIMKEIMNTSGFGYDPINKCIEVDPQVWSDYIEKYPNRKKYRDPKLWRYFDEFAEVFGDSHATGKQSDTLNNFIYEDVERVPHTPASQSTPMYMNPESSQSFTQMLH